MALRILGAVLVLGGPLLLLGVGLRALKKVPGYLELKEGMEGNMPGVLRGFGPQELEEALKKMRALDLGNGGNPLGSFRAFLLADLVFPLFYGVGLVAAIYLGLDLSDPTPSPLWYLAPILAVVADWTENSVLLRQLARFENGQDLEGGWVRLGQWSTIVKSPALMASLVICAVLAVKSAPWAAGA